MGNVTYLKDYKKQESEVEALTPEEQEEANTFKDLEEKNKQNKERVAKERQKANQAVLNDYKIKKPSYT